MLHVSDLPQVCLEWTDAVRDSMDYPSMEDICNASLVSNISMGWLASATDERVILITESSTSGEVDYLVIPAGWVTKTTRLSATSPAQPKEPQ